MAGPGTFDRRASLKMLGGHLLAAVGCRQAAAGEGLLTPKRDPADDPLSRRRELSLVRPWGVQLQNSDVDKIAASPLDLIVVDHALDEPGRVVARPEDVARLKAKPGGGRRIVLAYLSVGEAETFRPYWKPEWAKTPPEWLGPSNPNWPGSFVAKYWEKSWQDIVFRAPDSILNAIITAGFDGAFLDRVDAYSDWEARRPAAPAEMVELVAALATHARAANPAFILMSQNSEPLLRRKQFRDLIDAVSKESLLYGLPGPELPNSDSDIAWSLTGLNAARSDGIPVFAIEYLNDPQKIEAARRRLESLGFVPFFATRALDRMPGAS